MTWRPKQFRLGKMRERISIQESRECIAPSGQPTHEYIDRFTREPASFVTVRGGEVFRGKTIEANVSAVFDIHYRDGVVPKMQVKHDGKVYGIEYVDSVEGGKRYMTLFCKAVADG